MFKNNVYLGVLFLVIGLLAGLPLISMTITTSARGVIRSQSENTKIISVVSGRIITNNLQKNNQQVNQGETLLVVTAEQLDTQKNLQTTQSSDCTAQVLDLIRLIRNRHYVAFKSAKPARIICPMHDIVVQVL